MNVSKKSKEYVLGSSDTEIERLAYQHQVWQRETADLWERAGIGLGSKVADIGCGPGFCTKAFSMLVGSRGHVYAVDASEKFAEIVEVETENVSNISFYKNDVTSTDIESSSVDAVFARWLFCFLPNPEQAIKEAARILKPGGRIAIFDYFHYLAADVFPQNPAVTMLFEAYMKEVKSHGGSWDIGGDLPGLLADAGFQIDSLTPICRIGQPGSSVWKWVEYYSEVSVPRLVESGIWTITQKKEFEEAWATAAANPNSFFFTPPMIGIVGTLER